MTPTTALRAIKVVHTVVWAFFAGCIVTIPILAVTGRIRGALFATALVLIEVGVLVANGFVCPLTRVAARYTSDRSPNFDIYLPVWLARYNQIMFGSLFVGALLVLLFQALA